MKRKAKKLLDLPIEALGIKPNKTAVWFFAGHKIQSVRDLLLASTTGISNHASSI